MMRARTLLELIGAAIVAIVVGTSSWRCGADLARKSVEADLSQAQTVSKALAGTLAETSNRLDLSQNEVLALKSSSLEKSKVKKISTWAGSGVSTTSGKMNLVEGNPVGILTTTPAPEDPLESKERVHWCAEHASLKPSCRGSQFVASGHILVTLFGSTEASWEDGRWTATKTSDEQQFDPLTVSFQATKLPEPERWPQWSVLARLPIDGTYGAAVVYHPAVRIRVLRNLAVAGTVEIGLASRTQVGMWAGVRF